MSTPVEVSLILRHLQVLRDDVLSKFSVSLGVECGAGVTRGTCV